MGTLRGSSRAETSAAFNDLTTNYLTALFDVCLRETEREAGRRLTDRALPAVYLTGGHSRGRPYDEDYDFVVLTATDDADSHELAERTIVRMNRQIARRGVIAQYHFGDRLGRFVTSLDDLVEWLSGDEADLFVDRCQLLGSRLIVGSQKVEEDLIDRILRPQVFERWEEFTESLGREIHERRARYRIIEEGVIHLKEMPGGLRELDLGLMAAGARLGVRQLTGEWLYSRLTELDPDNSESYGILREASHFLIQLRSVYRVAVAASDVMEQGYMTPTARILGYDGRSGEEPAVQLFREIRERAAEAAGAVDRLLEAAGAPRTA
jgi:UTP:GlnB (protein PII) uridylyltransferase